MRAARGELLYTEMACSLSHLRAIDLALSGWADPQWTASLARKHFRGANYGGELVGPDMPHKEKIQDDIEVYPEFGADLGRLLTNAPAGEL